MNKTRLIKTLIIVLAIILFGSITTYIFLAYNQKKNVPSSIDKMITPSPTPSSPEIKPINIENEKVDLYPIEIFDKYGYIDSKGEIKIEPIFDYVEDFYNGMAKVRYNREYCFINKTGEIKIKGDFFEYADDFVGNYAVVYKDGNDGVIDRNGKLIIDFSYKHIRNLCHGIFAVEIDSKWGLVDAKGNCLLDISYEEIGKYSEGLIAVKKKDKWGYINIDGDYVIQPIYKYADTFNEGYAVISLEGNIGFIDYTGKLLNDNYFEDARGFHDGFAAVCMEDQWGYIDKTGTLVIKPQFEDAQDFSGNVAMVMKDEDYDIIDKKGYIILKHKDDDFSCENGYIIGRDYYGSTIYDETGKVLRYTNNGSFHFVEGDVSHKLIKMYDNGRVRYIDEEQNIIWTQKNKMVLDNGTELVEKMLLDDNKYLYYPQFSVLKNYNAKSKINEFIKKSFDIDDFYKEDEWNTGYKIEYIDNNILSLSINVYGMSRKTDGSKLVLAVFDLNTGNAYALKDLFLERSDYKNIIADIINQQTNEEHGFEFDFDKINLEHQFCILKDSITIPVMLEGNGVWFDFIIPFNDIDNMINKKGTLWKVLEQSRNPNTVKEKNEIDIASEYLMDHLNIDDESLITFKDYSVNGKYLEFDYYYDTYAVNIQDHSILKRTSKPDDQLGGVSYEYYQATCEFDGINTKRYEKVYNKHFKGKDGSQKVNEASSYIIWLPELEETNTVNIKINKKLKQYNKDMITKYDTFAKKYLEDENVLQSIKENDCIAAVYVRYCNVKYYITRYDDEIIKILIVGYDNGFWEETLSFSTKTGEMIEHNILNSKEI